jgi:predicted dehydrogenase
MALYVTPEQKETGRVRFQEAAAKHPVSRRDFLKGVAAGSAAVAVGVGAYYGYTKLHGNPVRTGLIGAGDEGGVLVGEHNPEFLEFVAYSDIRPTNQVRIFKGEPTGPRKGFNRIYGDKAKDKIKLYPEYKDLLADKNIEAVVIALPLNLHAQVAIDAMRAGKHVLCEKLMAWNVAQCKDMIRTADDTDKVLTIGHQRHYSMLYAQALEIINSGELGTIKHIRALWHRNNTWPRLDKDGKAILDKDGRPMLIDGWRKPIPKEDADALPGDLKRYDFKDVEELVRWRLFNRTGGGLMAELGSHQLDACSIFLGKVHPLAVLGYGGKIFYEDEREIDDHVFVTFEFPGKDYYQRENNGNLALAKDGKPLIKKPNDKVVVTYSSINTNNTEAYGECVMGTHGTLVTEEEQRAFLYPIADPNKKPDPKATGVTTGTAGGGKPAADSTSTTGFQEPGKVAGVGAWADPISRGYREEMEHFAYCVRMHDKETDPKERERWRKEPRCHGRVAMADAIIALTSNLAMAHNQRIAFEHDWFEAASSRTPEDDFSKKV